ncbi:pyridoxamine 5'-phosphate oxidase [Gryllotalpicola daejeonensis]|uniref:Pyridoxamine 5'-phosphate oxidase n=1 Tax=Gryllotalpicola daejeonensis TaxID=993087 RepID=A0ABP7ZER1_9MICO
MNDADTYGHVPDDLDAAPADPRELLKTWLPAVDDPNEPLMTLATVGLDGYPNGRTVLLSGFDGERIHFHTSAHSGKVAELAALPRATAVLVWPELARQVVITGDVAPETSQEASAEFPQRSRALQLLEWVNTDELAARPVAERREKWAEFDSAHPEDPLEPPATWLGYAITPLRVVFWRGDSQGPSNRLVYTWEDHGWSLQRKAG